MSGKIEALYIYDDNNQPLLQHIYTSRIPSARTLLPLYHAAHPSPRPSLLYLPTASPPLTVCSLTHATLLFLSPSTSDTDPLFILEFLHRIIDILEDFLGAPLLAHKIENNYDVVAQLLVEMCDAGIVCNTEANSLHESVEIEGWMGKLLGGLGSATSGGTSSQSSLSGGIGSGGGFKAQQLALNAANNMAGPAIPWRRPGVRHTSNELYVDIVETLSVTLAPSGRPLSAIVSGSIAFTAKISGVPDLLLTLSSSGGGKAGIARTLELPVFHPCVRLARWKERPGELSFIPPDGRFMLAGYEVDLLPPLVDEDKPPSEYEKLFLPASVDLVPSLGVAGTEFEVRLSLDTNFPGSSAAGSGGGGGMGSGGMGSNRPGTTGSSRGSGTSTPSFLGGGSGSGSGNSSSPNLEAVVVSVAIPKSVRTITDLRPSRGDAQFMPGSELLEWKVPTKGAGSVSGTATLRCTVVGYAHEGEASDSEEDEVDDNGQALTTTRNLSDQFSNYYEDPSSYQAQTSPVHTSFSNTNTKSRAQAALSSNLNTSVAAADTLRAARNMPSKKQSKVQERNRLLMPTSASVSFSVKGWLPSGIKVESLILDQRKSRGVSEGMKPYKGVKYLCVSRRGIEKRC